MKNKSAERWELLCPSWRRVLRTLPLTIWTGGLCLAGGWICFFPVSEFISEIVHGSGFDWILFLFSFISPVLFVLPFGYFCFWIIRECCSMVTVTPQGIEQARFGKRYRYIPWDEVAEAGIIIDHTDKFLIRCFCFSDRHLGEFERVNFRFAFDRKKGGRMILVPGEKLQNEDALRCLCPIPIPLFNKPQVSRYIDLVSYRRTRNADGSWGETEIDVLGDASGVQKRFQKLQNRWPWQR